MLRFSKLRNKQYLSLVCNFKFFFIFYSWVVNTQCGSKLHNYCCVFSQIGRFFLFNYGLCSYGKLFLEKFKKRLRNGQRSTLKNQETVSVWKLVIFKKLQRSPLITVSYNWILRVEQIGSNLIKLDQIDQTWSNWFQLDQIGANWIKLDPIGIK